MKFSLINLLWVIINGPFAVITIIMLSTGSFMEMLVPLTLLMILTAFLLFPSTTALFAITREWIMESEQSSLLKRYWALIRENYRTSFRAGSVYAFIWAVWFLDYQYLSSVNDLLGMILIIAGILLFVNTVVFFCFHSHYRMPMKKLFSNSLLVTLGSPVMLLGTIVLGTSFVYFTARFPVVFIFFTGSVFAYLSFYLFFRYTLSVNRRTA
ncbi:YesL family protein [Alteribacter lacisalsi]|nr:DUF624 domain-containing protein [Alteribacter lacisalsi]